MPTRRLKQGQTYWVPSLVGASGHLVITTYRITAVKGDTVWYRCTSAYQEDGFCEGSELIEDFMRYDLYSSYNTAVKKGLYSQEIHRKTWSNVNIKLKGLFKNKLVLYKVKD